MSNYVLLEKRLQDDNSGVKLFLLNDKNYHDNMHVSYAKAGFLNDVNTNDFRENVDLFYGKKTRLELFIPLIVSGKLIAPTDEENSELKKGLEALCSSMPSIDGAILRSNYGLAQDILAMQYVSGDVYTIRLRNGRHEKTYSLFTRNDEKDINTDDGILRINGLKVIDFTSTDRLYVPSKGKSMKADIEKAGEFKVHRSALEQRPITKNSHDAPNPGPRLVLIER
jgi:hypothetical protein